MPAFSFSVKLGDEISYQDALDKANALIDRTCRNVLHRTDTSGTVINDYCQVQYSFYHRKSMKDFYVTYKTTTTEFDGDFYSFRHGLENAIKS